MNSASPTTSASTNRGGRPKDWTEPRARRLVRLYIYTRLPLDLILNLLEEGVWKPGKDAANKVKNSLLGNDPRWIRPKDDDDERRRITALRNSRRGAKHRKKPASPHPDATNPTARTAQEDDSITLTHSRQPSLDDFDVNSHGLAAGVGTGLSNSSRVDHGSHRFSWMISNIDTSRQDTGLTNSTETSMTGSFVEKLTAVSRDQAKGAWRVLKQYTFPRDDLQRGTSFSPIMSPGFQFQPSEVFHRHDPSSARYAVPGDFLNAYFFSAKIPCDTESGPHQTKTCWCRIADELLQDPTMLPFGNDEISVGDISSDVYYQRVDAFNNTAFHRLAALNGDKESFIGLISQALQYPNLPVRLRNTAGQTFLHVLHWSWFDERIFFDELLNVLKGANFDILATDVYGRSFFHVMQNRKQGAARIPAHFFEDWSLLQRRDAFGVKPMERVRQSDVTTAQAMRRGGPLSPRGSGKSGIPPTTIDIPTDRGDESRIRNQTEMITIVVDAIKVDNVGMAQSGPRAEDSRGRNAFHCLAEVELNVQRIQDPSQDTQRKKKRKFKEEEEETKPTPSRHDQRVEYLEGIIHAKADVNHYDNRGQTPLMSFIKYRPEESRADKENMERIIRMLHEAGADLEKRNRDGETALHVAARSGKKVALKELLQLGANPNVRDAYGLSVLAAIDELFINAERDGALIARLEACRGVFSSMAKAEAQEPTVRQEWGARRPAALPIR